TLYNSNYSAKGLAMYYSLLRHCQAFHLYIFAFDNILVEALNKMKLEHVTVVTLKEFEDEELLKVKQTRTAGEYCWTCSSSTILYCLEHFNIDSCTYIDADLYFYSDPQVLIDEMGEKDVSIIPHRYTPKYDQSKTAGIYCVQFMTFKNTPKGLEVLKWWRERCLEWCYARHEDGKFGDQKYLDDWLMRFDCVCELQNLGGGVAPWNQQQYAFRKEKNEIVGIEESTGKKFNVIFYHFHNLRSFSCGIFRDYRIALDYELPNDVKKLLYLPYIKEHNRCFRIIKKIDHNIDGIATEKAEYDSWVGWIKKWRRHKYIEKNNRYFYWIE
ncbi:MAG: hypothetical protein KBT22_11165, partial [Bacteroidales bacterium]|nr:hypothetical protein [Candidatus Scybalocola fimicaballi]